jgi:TolA-binding protein
MSAPSCARAWQAEAVEDGRLAPADAASFARHAAGCRVCARETRWLAELRSTAARLPQLVSTELEQRRLRYSVLQRANALALRRGAVQRMPAWSWWSTARAAAVATTASALALTALFALRDAPSAKPGAQPSVHANGSAAVGVPSFQLTAAPGAIWQTVQRSATLKLAAASGRFELAVDPLRAGQRFLVELPDGELEVRGTRFALEVEPTRTLAVRVSEGRVELRLRGQVARMLSAGEAWSAEPQQPAVATSASPPGDAQAAPPARALTPARTRERASKPASVPATAAESRAGRAFAAAMAAFSAGDLGRADRLFAAFERAHPADARVEDAAFLRAVAHARRGDLRASQAAAREYLRRYPNGLRRAEADRLAR